MTVRFVLCSDRELAAMRNVGDRICVIGAGPCGLTTVKNLLSNGLDNVECYDESGSIGGNWAFSDAPDRTTVHENTHIISSKRGSAFEDFPMPDDYPDFPSHRQILAYCEDYARHFGLMSHIRLKTSVRQASLRSDGRWSIRLSQQGGDEEERVFDHLVVCSGHHRTPYFPDYSGRFNGPMLHSGTYKRADPFRSKRVLIVGAGNSGADIAVSVSRLAARTCISMRRGYNFLPKLICGTPIDVIYARARRKLPRRVLEPVAVALRLVVNGSAKRYGLQKASGNLFAMHPTLNAEFLSALRHGTVIPRVGIERFDGSSVHFVDGKVEPFDVVIWATGFEISFPFFDASVIDWNPVQRPPLYLRMMHPQIANLFFVGLFQPMGCIWPLADHQAHIVALQITGRLERPSNIDQRIEKEIAQSRRQFDSSLRHSIEVDSHDFRRDLAREIGRAQI